MKIIDKLSARAKNTTQVDLILFKKREYILWWATLIIGVTTVLFALAMCPLTDFIIVLLTGIFIVAIPYIIWMSRASSYIKHKEDIK